MITIAVDLPEVTALVVMVIVIEAHLAVATMKMIVHVMADLLLLQEAVFRLMTILLLAALASMIRIVAITHPLTPTSMAMADLTIVHQETTHQEMLDMPMIIAAATSNSSFQGWIPYGPNSHK
jgi:hypothetical protein